MTSGGTQARILIVEDEAALADTVLRLSGFAVHAADCGAEALATVRRVRPDIVILDLMLPEVSGLDVCRQIRQISNVPIIMVTAKDSEADKVSGLELGGDDYVTKPFSVRELVSRVRAHLRREDMTGGSATASRCWTRATSWRASGRTRSESIRTSACRT